MKQKLVLTDYEVNIVANLLISSLMNKLETKILFNVFETTEDIMEFTAVLNHNLYKPILEGADKEKQSEIVAELLTKLVNKVELS